MKITYIGHSGFLAETQTCCYIFDYYNGELPPIPSGKEVIVFSSHAHQDHYAPKIFGMLREAGIRKVTAVLSEDITPDQYPRNREEVTVLSVSCHRTYELPCGTKVYTLRSTDEGVAFLLQCPEGTLYHAGDLNDWVWPGESDAYNHNMTKDYRRELNLLKTYCQEHLEGRSVDVACVPLDPRQEEFYARGMLGFLREIPVSEVYPMHFWDRPEIINRFLRDYPEFAHLIKKCTAV